MKKKLLYGLAGLLVALSLTGFAACSDDDDDGGRDNTSDSSDVDLDDYTLGDGETGPTLLVSASKLSGATSVVIVFTYDTGSDCWLNICSDADWNDNLDVGWQDEGTYTLTLTDSLCKVKNAEGEVVFTTTTYTLSTYTSGGIYVAAGSTSGGGTVEIVSATVYYDEEEETTSDGTATYVAAEYGDETTDFTSVTVTYDSDYVITEVVAELDDSKETLSILSTWTDDGVTYYYSSFQTDEKIYYLYLYYSDDDGKWCYYYYSSSYIAYTASWGGSGDNALADYTVTVYASDGDVGWVEVNIGSTYYDVENYVWSDDVTTCSFTVDGEDDTSTIYTLTLTYDSSKDTYSYTYTSVGTQNLTATTEQTSIGTVLVRYNSTEGIQSVTVDGNTTSLDDDEGTYTYSVYSDDYSTTTTYAITVTVSTSGDTPTASYSYTIASVTLTASYSGSGDSAFDAVTVTYSEDEGISSVMVMSENIYYYDTVDEETSTTEATLSWGTNGVYYEVTVSVDTSGDTPTASYTYTKSSTSTYEASGEIDGVTVTVEARVIEAYDESETTYTVSYYYLDEIADSDGNAYSYSSSYDDDGNLTYTFTVEDNDSATIYTLSLGYSTTDGLAFTYTYESVTTNIYTAEGALDETVKVYYDTDNSSIEKVTMGEDTLAENTDGTYWYSVHSDDGSVQYTLDVSVASGKASYTTTITINDDNDDVFSQVHITVDSSGEITAVTVNGGEEADATSDNYVWTVVTLDNTLYTLTIASDYSSYTCEESGSTVSGSLYGSISSGTSTTLTAPSGVSKITIKWTYDSLASSSDTTAIYLGDWAWQVNFGANSISSGATSTLTITSDGTSCDSDSWIYDQTSSSSGTTLTLSDIVDDYSGEFTLYLWSSNSTTLHYTVTYTTE